MAIPMILLAAQASGIGMNLWANMQANKISKAGARVEKQELDLRMEQMALQSSEQSLVSLENLREVMASQRALMGARGQMAGAGSAKAIEQGSLRAFGDDERARKMSLSFAQTQMAGQKRLIDINRYGMKAQRGAKMVNQAFDMFSPNSAFGKNAINKGSGSING